MTYGLAALDLWRLSDELSVIDASFLAIGLDPGDFAFSSPIDPMNSAIFRTAGFSDEEKRMLYNEDCEQVVLEPREFRAVFKGIRTAILTDRLSARLSHRARDPEYVLDVEGRLVDTQYTDEEKPLYYSYIVRRGELELYSNASKLLDIGYDENNVIYVLHEPDWSQTMVSVTDLQSWFKERGVFPDFFFPEGAQEGFREQSHPRYSPKLATAVAAWEAVTEPERNKSAKRSLADWIRSNGVNFGLGGKEKVVTETMADELAKIANWDTAGGATPTGRPPKLEKSKSSETIQNFDKLHPDDDTPPF